MLVGWCVDELDLGRKLAQILLVSEDVEGFFFGDVPLDGGVGAGGAYGLDLVLGGLDEWTARCFSDSACFVLQAAFFRSRNSLSTSSGVRYPRAE